MICTSPSWTAGAAEAASTPGRHRRQFRRFCPLFRSAGRRHPRRPSQGTRQGGTGGQSSRRRPQNTRHRRRGQLLLRLSARARMLASVRVELDIE